MVSERLLKNETLLGFVKDLRKDNIVESSSISLSTSRHSLVSDNVIDTNTQKLSEFINNTNPSAEIKDKDSKIIQMGTELFLYLNANRYKPFLDYWTEFYSELFTNGFSSQQQVLSLFGIARNPKSKDAQEIANKILVKLSEELGFNYNKPDVLKNGILSQIHWKNNIKNIQGRLQN